MFTRRVRRYAIALAIVVLLVAAYAAAGFLAVPHFLRSGLNSFVSTHYGRTLSIGDIHFNPFTFTLDVADFSLPDTDGQAMIAFGRLHVDLEIASLWRLGPSFRAIVLERPSFRTVVRKDGTLNVADLGKGFASSPPAKPASKAQEPMRLFIDRLAVVAGSGTFEDRSRPTPFRAEFKPIAFELRHFSTRARTGNEYSLTAASPEGERLDWNGSILLEPLASHGAFAITNLQASTIWNYLQQPLPLEVPAGIIGLKGDYDLDLAGATAGLKVNVHAAAVTDLKLRPLHGAADYIALTRLDIQETRLDLAAHSVEVGKVALTGGEVNSWLSPQGRLNLLELTTPTGAPAVIAAGEQTQASTTTTPAAAGTTAGASAPPTAAQEPDSTPAKITTSGPVPVWTVSVPEISVEGLKVSTEDREVTPAVALVFDPLSVHVTGFNTTPAARLDITAKTSINSTGTLEATAQFSPHSGEAAAHIELAQLDLTTFQPFIAQRTAMTLQSGRLGTKLDIQHPADGSVALQGDAQVTGLRTVDNELQQSFIKWKDLRATGIQYGSQPASLRIDSIVAREPYARVIIAKNQTVNVAEVLAGPHKGTSGQQDATGAEKGPGLTLGDANGVDAKIADAIVARTNGGDAKGADAKELSANGADAESAEAKEAEAKGVQGKPASANATEAKSARHSRKSKTASAASAGSRSAQPDASVMPISIGRVQILDGSANYADFWIQPNFAVGIQTLNGSINGLSSDPRSRAKVQLDGKVDRYAPVHIAGEVNLLTASVYSDIKMSFKGLELTTMTPYSGHFAGYKIDKGKLSVDLSYKVEQRKLVAEQRFVIDQLQLGDRVDSPDAVKLPLRLAVALLKDRNGVIDLPLPISGSLDDPQFKLGSILWKAVVNLLVKVATAPFALLGHLFGGGEEMNFIDFPAGSAQVDDAARQKLTGLTKALQERPQLQLDLPIVFSQQLDRPVLAARVLRQKLLARERSEHPPKKQDDEAARDAALSNPLEHYRLLLAEYQAELGKNAPLPPLALAIQTAKSKKDAPPVEPAIPELEAALIAHIEVPDVALQELGKKRTEAIRDALLADGGIDGSRVFVINGPPRTESGDKVRVEMSLK
ncbi:MAG: hypothetical protein JWM63_4122 [Gammaproteobacteria bacterium]|nr:hypothetical protein [Gammaproteobacteria bacterium]